MKKLVFGLMFVLLALAYGNIAEDELLNQDVVTINTDPAVLSIVQRMDQAKQDGNMELFNNLLNEYENLMKPHARTDGPQGIVHSPEPEHGQGNIIDWATDVVIDSAWEFPSISMDTRSDGYIFVAAEKDSTSSSARNVIPIWYSTDGSSWTLYYTIFWVGHDCRNPSCQVVESNTTQYLYVMFDGRETSSPYETDLWILIHEFGGSNWDYYAVSQVSGVDEADPSMDADDYQYTSGIYLYCAFESGDSIAFMRSLNYGPTWQDRQIIASGASSWDYLDPSLSYGWYASADSFTVGIAWQYNQSDGAQRIRFRRNRTYGTSGEWLPIEYFGSPTGHLDNNPQLRMTHGTMPSGTIVFARKDTTGTDQEDFCNFYTYDGARNWTCDTLYSGGSYEVLTALANDHSANDYHAFFRGDYDDIRYKEAHYDDLAYGGWSYSIGISDAGQAMSGYTNPAAAELNDDPCVVWKDISNSTWYKLMFDALWTGVEEMPNTTPAGFVSLAPSISRGSARLSYSLSETGHVKITMFDAAGRLVKSIVDREQTAGEYTLAINNSGLAAGIYFVRVETPQGTVSKTMTVIR
jgi:hypothetical protein